MPIKQLKPIKRDSSNLWKGKKPVVRVSKKSSVSSFSKNTWRKDKKSDNKKIILKKLLLIVLGLALLGSLFIFIFVMILSKDLPSPSQLLERQVAQSTVIYDRSGEHILYEISGNERRTLVSIDEIPDHVQKAVVALEDKDFYNHSGFSFLGIVRSAITNIIYGRRAGGSTLTQQFVKNAVLTPEKTIIRKIKELIIAYRLEKKFSKEEILQMYLNEIPYGSNAYGVEAASQKYFGKSVREVSLAESAVLAAIVQVPTRYSPYGPNKDILLGRKDYVLKIMQEQGYISLEEKNKALEEEIVFQGRETNITAPHFVMYIKDILTAKYGEKMVEQGGLKIYTTLDLEKQKIAEEVLREKTENYESNYKATNASLVAVDPKTGQILTMLGSRDYFNDEIQGQVNIAIRDRQPGSSIKPLVYAALFEKGYTANSILYDVTTNFSNDPNNPYKPRNYSLEEAGPVSVRKALAGSLNIPAVKTLYLAGLNDTINLLEDFGYSTFAKRDRFGLAFVLGGAEVKLLEHTNAFSAFANEGEIREISGILKVEDNTGEIIEEWQEKKKTVLSQESARIINDIMSDNSARSFIFGERNSLSLPNRPVAAKTGTTNEFRDAWTMGYSPSLVVGVWVGNNDNKKMSSKADGSVVAAPIWNEFMKRALEGSPVENFNKPENKESGIPILDGQIPSQKIKINILTNLPANESTDPSLIKEIEIPNHHSILHYINKEDPLNKDLFNKESDPQYELWESAVLDWVKRTSSTTDYDLINSYNENKDPKNNPTINNLNIKEGDNIEESFLYLEFEASAPLGLSLINYYLNDNLVLSEDVSTNPDKKKFNNSLNLSKLSTSFHSFKIQACDPYQNCYEKKINFNLSSNNKDSSLKPTIEIINPASGLAASLIDFPLPLTIQISEIEKIYSASLLVKNSNNELVDANQIKQPQSTIKNLNIKINTPGSYLVYPEIKDVNGNTISGNTFSLLVN